MASPLTFKFLIIGDTTVGKTSIVNRLVNDSFGENSDPTVGVDFITHTVTIDKTQIKLQIWDTAGQERYKSLGRAYYRDSLGVFFVFSLDDHSTFQNIEQWYKDVMSLSHPKAQVALIGNKSDLIENRRVTDDEAQKLANSLKIQYFETSAKTGTGVTEAVLKTIRKIYNLVMTNEIVLEDGPKVSVDDDEDQGKKKGCCK